MLERLKEPLLDPLTGEPLFLAEQTALTRRTRGNTALVADVEMQDEDASGTVGATGGGGRKPRK
jgi:hypothetical protein